MYPVSKWRTLKALTHYSYDIVLVFCAAVERRGNGTGVVLINYKLILFFSTQKKSKDHSLLVTYSLHYMKVFLLLLEYSTTYL